MVDIVCHELIVPNLPTKMCHASTLLRLEDNSVLCAWFGGTKEGEGDVSIWCAKKENGIWGHCKKIAQSKEAHWNPVLFQLSEKEIILFYKVGQKISKWRTMILRSLDGGKSFGEPEELVKNDAGGRGPVRNKAIRLSNGTIAAPGSTEEGIWQAFVDLSEDEGKTWKKSEIVKIENIEYEQGKKTTHNSSIPVSEQSFYGRGVIQPTLWESAPGLVHMFLRSTEGRIYRSDSKDYGRSFGFAYPTKMPNNNSGIDVAKLQNGDLILVYNPVDLNWGPRTPITLAQSKDNGVSFTKIMDLDTGEGEFAYPAIIAKGNEVMISYTYKRENIAFWQIKFCEKKNHKGV